MHRPVFLRTFAPQFGTPTIYRVAVANISKCASNLSSETAAVLTAKTRRPSSGCKLRVQFPGASAVYPSSMRHPNVVQTLGIIVKHSFWQKYLDDCKTSRNFAAEYSRKYVFIMATVVLQVPDESLVSKVKSACKMLVGVTSVRVQKSTPKVDDITKTAHYKEAMDDVKNGRVYHANSVDDMFKQILG